MKPPKGNSQGLPMPIWECYCKIEIPGGLATCPYYTIVSWVQPAYLDCCLNNKFPDTSIVYHPVYTCNGQPTSTTTVYIDPSYVASHCPGCGPPM